MSISFTFIYWYTGSGIQNVFEKKEHIKTMEDHLMVQNRGHILANCLFRTTVLFIQDHPVFLLESVLIRQQYETGGAIKPP